MAKEGTVQPASATTVGRFDRCAVIVDKGEEFGAIMILPNDIHTLDSFRRQSKQHVDRLKETGRPEVLTVNGKPALVVQDASAYQAQMEKLQVLESLAESVRQAEGGQVKEARPAIQALLDDLRSKRG